MALVASINRSIMSNTTTAMCGANGTLTLVHLFPSTRFVPIGNTPVVLQRIDPNVSRTTRSSSIAPAWAPNLIIAYFRRQKRQTHH